MKPSTSRVTSQGQVSVPAEIRRRLGLATGSVLEWRIEDDEVVVRRAGRSTLADIHAALFDGTPRRRTLEQLKEGLRTHAKRRRGSR